MRTRFLKSLRCTATLASTLAIALACATPGAEENATSDEASTPSAPSPGTELALLVAARGVAPEPGAERVPLVLHETIVLQNASDGASSEVILEDGTYQVTVSQDPPIEIFAEESGERLLVKAAVAEHAEDVEAPEALFASGEVTEGNPHLMLLLPDGRALDAEASYDEEIRSRATAKALSRARVSVARKTSVVAKPTVATPTATARANVTSKLEARQAFSRLTGPAFYKGLQRDRVVVKFKEGAPVRTISTRAGGKPSLTLAKNLMTATDPARLQRQGVTEARVRADLGKFNQIVARKNVRGLRPLFTRAESLLRSERAKAERKTGEEYADLANYYTVFVEEGQSADALVAELNALESVEVAYLPPMPEDADIAPPTANLEAAQDYLNAAPGGIDARYAWTKPGGRGLGIRVVDIEGGWTPDHEDLRTPFMQDGLNVGDGHHGTAVMGEIIGRNDSRGVTGITSDSTWGFASVVRPAGVFGHAISVADAINAAASRLSAGDAILIEQHSPGPRSGETCTCNCAQFEYIAMEFWPAVFDAIRAATAKGIYVIEAAGNGSMDLDAARYSNAFNRNVRDSRAIIVGASKVGGSGNTRSGSRSPTCWTNSGDAVDVHGWGEKVRTTGYGEIRANGNDKRQFYTSSFSGTSSASPIVTGAVMAIAGVREAAGLSPLSPVAMRNLLRTTGSAQVGGTDRNIGPQPNLRAAIDTFGDLDFVTPPAGGNGGSAFSLGCGSGRVLVGIKGRSGALIDQIRGVCATGSGSRTNTSARGGNGGNAFERICPTGSAVVGIRGRSGSLVDRVQLECRGLNGNNPSGTRTELSAVGGNGGRAFGWHRCPTGMGATRLIGRSGSLIDRLQMKCEPLDLDTSVTSWTSPAAGGNGGTSFSLTCPTGRSLVGVRGRGGWYLDRIQGVCAAVSSNGNWSGSLSNTAARGGNGGSARVAICPNGQAVSGISGRSGSLVDRLVVECRDIAPGRRLQGGIAPMPWIGGNGGSSFGPHRCPDNLPAKGLRGRSGSLVDRIQLHCAMP